MSMNTLHWARFALLCAVVTCLCGAVFAGVTERVSVASDGTQGNQGSSGPCISSDGRFVALSSSATNLVSGDTNGKRDVFVYDRRTGQVSRVSVSSAGSQGNGNSSSPSISSDGRYVAFESDATNLVSGDTNAVRDVFLRDTQTGQTSRVSVSTGGGQGNASSSLPAISGDGRYVAFESWASNLVTGDTNASVDVFVRDTQTGQTTRVSVASDGTEADYDSLRAAISADGRYVAFASDAENLIPDDANYLTDVFVHDRQTGQTTLVSLATDGTRTNDVSWSPAISSDGRYVAFPSWASNLVPGDGNDTQDVFIRDRQTSQTSIISVNNNGIQGDSTSLSPAISGDGRCVAFVSDATNLAPSDTNGCTDVFLRDRQTGQTSRISLSTTDAQGGDISGAPRITPDGRYVAFDSYAANLVPGDTNACCDIFVRDRQTIGQTKAQASATAAVVSANTVTAAFPGCFYVEEIDRTSGTKVLWAGAVTQGKRYRVDGTITTDVNGEQSILATSVRSVDTLAAITALGVNNKSLGGGAWDYDQMSGSGQQGVKDGAGLNNIGLLVRAWGKFTKTGDTTFTLDDGSGVDVKCIAPQGVTLDPSWSYLAVTGISSCEKVGDELYRLIRATSISPT